jgi:uncharacterized protein
MTVAVGAGGTDGVTGATGGGAGGLFARPELLARLGAAIARLADAEGVPLFAVGGFSSLRPAAGAPRFVTDLSHAPVEFHDELVTVSVLVTDDLPATSDTLDCVFVSPAGNFGSFAPGERLGEYRVGDDVAVQPQDGGSISGADYALGFVDLIERRNHHRAHVNLAY